VEGERDDLPGSRAAAQLRQQPVRRWAGRAALRGEQLDDDGLAGIGGLAGIDGLDAGAGCRRWLGACAAKAERQDRQAGGCRPEADGGPTLPLATELVDHWCGHL